MIFLFKDWQVSGGGESERVVIFEKLRRLVESFPNGILIGRYKEGKIDDRGRAIEDSYLEIFYVEGRGNNEKRIERMYQIRRESVKQVKEIKKWIEEGRVRAGHINLDKYKHNAENPILFI